MRCGKLLLIDGPLVDERRVLVGHLLGDGGELMLVVRVWILSVEPWPDGMCELRAGYLPGEPRSKRVFELRCRIVLCIERCFIDDGVSFG